ncbi:aldo/keto reductase [Streptomyces sp. NPDC020192]|uniref:aldo/keto reductase n=1 Tax=Streptomyces sp. NPDC020192 TaxID=3365066 RepID=UPI0037B9F52F
MSEAAVRAAASGAQWIDAAPNYATGGGADPARPHPRRTPGPADLHECWLPHLDHGYRRRERRFSHRGPGPGRAQPHPGSRALADRPQPTQLGRDRLDLVLWHNPERAHPGGRAALHRAIRDAFAILEEAVAAGHAAGYGIATWAGLEEEAFTVGELLTLAAKAAGGRHHLAAIQLPVSLLMMTPIAQAFHGRGPLPVADGAGLRVMASAPLHGGQLPSMVGQELADLIRPGLTPARACTLSVASCPGVTDVLIADSSTSHWKEAADAVAEPTLTAAQLREITGVLASPLTRTPNSACQPTTPAPPPADRRGRSQVLMSLDLAQR